MSPKKLSIKFDGRKTALASMLSLRNFHQVGKRNKMACEGPKQRRRNSDPIILSGGKTSDPIIVRGAKSILGNTLCALNNAVHSGISKLTQKCQCPDPQNMERECLFSDKNGGDDRAHLAFAPAATPLAYYSDDESIVACHRTSRFYPWECKRQTQESSCLLNYQYLDETSETQVPRNGKQENSTARNTTATNRVRRSNTLKLPPLNNNLEYSSVSNGRYEDDDTDNSKTDEDEDRVSLKKRHREEILKLQDRIAMLESELKIRKNLEEAFVVESSCSSRSSNEDSAENNLSDDDDAAPVVHDEIQDTTGQCSILLDLIDIPHIDNCEARPETEAPSARSDVAQDISVFDPLHRDMDSERISASSPSLICFLESPQHQLPSDIKCCSLLTKEQVERYSRHLLLNEGFGVSGQVKLLQSSVLVIGAGGIGSTALLYLAAAGVGTMGVVDFDCVESSNLHRQIIHSSTKLGMNKATSAVMRMQELNPTVNFVAIQEGFHHQNATRLVSSYDCVVDASDNPFTRYLVNDACVLTKKPLVSGSSMGVEGQLTVHNYLGGPCYRCLYPKASPTEACKSCSDNGVLGPVPGMIGVLQAIEVIKILTGIGVTMHDKMLMYDALQCRFLSLKKTAKRVSCAVCGPDATIKSMHDSLRASVANNLRGPAMVMPPADFPSNKEDNRANVKVPSISCRDYFEQVIQTSKSHVLLDVRVEVQFAIVSLKSSVNIPLERLRDALPEVERLSKGTMTVYCVCRRGVASSEATLIIADAITSGLYPTIHSVRNVTGGLAAWTNEVDADFPLY